MTYNLIAEHCAGPDLSRPKHLNLYFFVPFITNTEEDHLEALDIDRS
jgi:hypothetical protein